MNQLLFDLPKLAPMLYVPADRPDLGAVLSGQRDLGICSLAVCLEDAVKPEHRKTASISLCSTLQKIKAAPRPIYIRPADVDAMEWLIENLPRQHITGFILPKATVAKIHLWAERSAGLFALLPILESREAIDPIGRRELGQACAAHHPLISSVRIGANDLFSLLGGLRRPKGRTIYETPVGRIIDAFIEIFCEHSAYLCGAVFDRITDLQTLEREVKEDVSRGLFAKTVLNPQQSKAVWSCYEPEETELDEAVRILHPSAPAVFASNGHMLETSCHAEWARRILERNKTYRSAVTRIDIKV